jgi:hypothetical protein
VEGETNQFVNQPGYAVNADCGKSCEVFGDGEFSSPYARATIGANGVLGRSALNRSALVPSFDLVVSFGRSVALKMAAVSIIYCSKWGTLSAR